MGFGVGRLFVCGPLPCRVVFGVVLVCGWCGYLLIQAAWYVCVCDISVYVQFGSFDASECMWNNLYSNAN